jgi:6-phosphogluconolactonase
MPPFCPVSQPEIIICRNARELALRAAEQFVALARSAIARSGRFAVALAGGSTPRAAYALLASPEFSERVDWPRVHLFWGDERCVPPDHADSNYRMVEEALLAKIRIPPENIHRMPGEKEPAAAAAAYEAELRKFFAVERGGWPRFDLIFLGLGEDGHTASLFPGVAALDETDRWVAAVYVEKFRSYRLTLTLPAINAAAQVTFLVSGASKAKIVGEILSSDSSSSDYPAAKVSPSDGRLTWMLDRDAAKDLPIMVSGRLRPICEGPETERNRRN